MTHKERVLNALNHKKTDRVPFMYRDVPEVRSRLKRDLNVDTDEELFQYLDIDFRWVEPEYIGPALEMPNGNRKDIWGVEWKYTRFSNKAGYWNEVSHPLIDIFDTEALDDYPWPTLKDWNFDSVEKICDQHSGYAIMTAPGIASPGIFQYPVQNLIGVERSFTEPLMDPDFFQKLVDKIVSFHVAFINEFFASANGKIDFFRIGDDFGTQRGLQIDVATWESFFQPAFRKMAETAKKYGAHYYQHSCGAIRDLIPSLLSAGVEVLDPLQIKAEGMNPAELKAEYGHLLTFSGGIDEQDLLPNGSTEKIMEEVAGMIHLMGRDGGYFLGSTHNFQDDIPTENILAMYKAGKETKIN